MAEKPLDTSQDQAPSESNTLDLNALSELNFGPSWADKSSKQPVIRKSASGKGTFVKEKYSRDSSKRDRRSPLGNNQPKGDERKKEGKPYRKREDISRRNRSSTQMFFEPTVKVDIYPQDEAFEVLVKRLRSTVRTYQLFEIAHLILEKPERYIVVVENKAKPDEKPLPLYFSLPGYLPFETEEAAINHVLHNHLDLFFDIESIEVEPPKGNFQMVNRCTVTGDLLGPPNDHRYQEFLQRHYTSKINGMSFNQFVSKVETLKDQESIDAWVESMKKGKRYILKERKDDEPESFESFEAVRMFLLQHRKDKIVGSNDTVRFSGRDIEQLPKGSLRRSIEAHIQYQSRFPLDTANNIRGRLRRHKFTVYKKGSKGISYVCAVKRKFRDSRTTFSSSIQELIKFIEKHPNVSALDLPKLHIGIDTEKQKPDSPEMDEAKVAAESPEPEEAIAGLGEETDATEVQTADPDIKSSADVAATAPAVELDEADQKRLKQLMLDLRWLIFEGYVTEYGDGSLFAPPPMPEAKQKEAPKKNASKEPDEVAANESEDNDTESNIQTDESVTQEITDEVESKIEEQPDSNPET